MPVRRAGALLPQLAVAGQIRRFPVRKWFWLGGGLGFIAAALGMRALVGLLTILALQAAWLAWRLPEADAMSAL